MAKGLLIASSDRTECSTRPTVSDVYGGVGDGFEELRVGAPGASGEGAVDLLVLDDVGPVADDPVLAFALLAAGGFEEFASVVEVERPALQSPDEGAAVVRHGGEDVVEFVSACVEFVPGRNDRPGGREAIGAGDPDPRVGDGDAVE